MPTRRILHTIRTRQATPATGVNKNLSTQCTRKTYLTSGNNFPTPKDMIGFMVCWVFFLQKATLVDNPYVCVLLAVMISSLANHSM